LRRAKVAFFYDELSQATELLAYAARIHPSIITHARFLIAYAKLMIGRSAAEWTLRAQPSA
jgi:hypothetical protein